MWVGVMIYTDGMDATFKKSKKKSEIIEWFKEHDYDVNEIEEGFFDELEGIRHEYIDHGLNMGYIVNLNANKKNRY